MNSISFYNEPYTILDAVEYITLADSFVKNKIGKGHGEAKLYIGNESERLKNFWGSIDNNNCFLLKKDIIEFLVDGETEYLNPQQTYINKNKVRERYYETKNKILSMKDDFIKFKIHRSRVDPPRVYINSNWDNYTLIREVGLPNISYLSVLKLLSKDNELHYYFKIFIDYSPEILGYTYISKNELEEISKKDISEKRKDDLIKSRIGQGKYREKLLEECSFCPITLVNDERILIASHIKPWSKSDDREKVDPKNGFILTPTYDKLFDKGFITFTSDRKILVSPWISPMNLKRLNLKNGNTINNLPMDAFREEYLKYHYNNIYKK